MKEIIGGVKIFFVIAGAVMGAGFLSGGELVGFFGGADLRFIIFAGAVFFVGFFFVHAGKEGCIGYALIAADFIFAAAMLSGLDGVAELFGLPKNYPVASVASLAAFLLFLSDDVKKVERVNCYLIPLSIVAVLCVILFAPKSEPAPEMSEGSPTRLIKALLYACMNVFVASPSVELAGKGKSRRARLIAAIGFSVFFVVFAFMILRVAPKNDFPLVYLAYGTPLYPLIVAAIFFGSFTSLVCCLYPLKNAADRVSDKKTRKAFSAAIYFGVFFTSRIGFSPIIKYLYPVVGALGAWAILKSLFGIKRGVKGDTTRKRSALCQGKRKTRSKSSPKKNTAII